MAKGTKVNTVASINSGSDNLSEREYQESLKRSNDIFKDMPKRKVMIPKQMQNVLGESVPIVINGCRVVVPVNGESYEIPEEFANILEQSLKVVQAEDVRAEVVEEMGLKGPLE